MGAKKIEEYVKIGFERPLVILEEFRKYSFLLERPVSHVIKSLFPDSKTIVTNLDRDDIENKL
jgi:hypothetical protein